MSVSKRFKTLYEENGVEYIFDTERFKVLYKALSQLGRRGTKQVIVSKLAAETIASESTVRGWLSGHNGVSSLETVNTIEDFFDLERGGLLTPRCETEEKEEGRKDMCEISNRERDAAREIYRMLVDMIDGLIYINPEISLQAGWPTTIQGFRYLGPTSYPFDYCDSLILKVRKLSFDLPVGMRNRIIEFIEEPFDEHCEEQGMLYLASERYRTYLEKNKLEDSESTRELYSYNYVRELYERLDELFADYRVA